MYKDTINLTRICDKYQNEYYFTRLQNPKVLGYLGENCVFLGVFWLKSHKFKIVSTYSTVDYRDSLCLYYNTVGV